MTDTVPHEPHQPSQQPGIYGPVTDWATDFDHADPEYNAHVHEIWADLRGSCPVAHTDRYNGAWLPVTHADVTAIAYDTEHFTSRSVVVNTNEVLAQAPIGGAPPITSDPPFHQHARRLLLPPFAPKQIDPWEDDVRTLCHELIDSMGDADVVDAALQYAQHIPVNVIARMLGFPLEDADMFRGFVHDVIEAVNVAPGARLSAFEKLDRYIDVQVQDHIDNPRDDLTTYLMNATIFDQPLSIEHVRGSIVLLLVAGIDTTWSAIGASIFHLAGNAPDLERLNREPELWPTAIEEFLRVFHDYNLAIWPAQVFAYALGLVALVAAFSRRDDAPRIAFAALAVLWAFVGIGYHLVFFARINPLAPVFAGFFVVQASLSVASAIRPGDLGLRIGWDLRSVAGLSCILYAVVIYPILGIRAGHGGMAGPMFGVAPCPTTIFTLGILIIARGRWVLWLSIIPVLWSLVGLAAALQLGILEDLGMPVAGAVLVALLATLRIRAATSGPETMPTRRAE
jgi:hypothetical protein